jgi:hypothetical protein
MKNIGYYIALFGLLIFAYSFVLDAYTNAEEYNEAYLSIDREALGREASFEAFHKLREKYLTNKFRYQDYGITFISLGLFLIIVGRKGWANISSPSAKWKTLLLGFGAALLTAAGYVGDLFLEFSRGSYPHWADSLGIPLAGMPIMLIILFFWAAFNMIGLGKYAPSASISNMGIHNINWWYGILSLLTALITLLCIYDGFFWLVFPGLLWLYFYLSVMAGRKAANKASQPTPKIGAAEL